jgi:hypothetical protein|nr:hypothetical protein [Kofleriaceae bacterium]
MNYSPLDASQLSPAAHKAVGPGPGKMMASRGMMPLPPADQVAVLYQLSIDSDRTIADAARETAKGLPEKLLAGTLGDGRLDPRVLDFFAGLVASKPTAFDAIAMNTATADETVATLAARGGPREVDLIAGNEQRLLRHPEIIGAMYMNKRARMSTVDRAIELAVRNHVRVPDLPCWDELARALQAAPAQTSSPEADALFAYAADALSGDDSVLTTGDADAPPPDEELLDLTEDEPVVGEVQIDKLSIPSKIRLATLGNAFARSRLIRDPSRNVALAAIKAPGVTDIEAARYASNQTLPEDVIRYIANRREWTKLYGIKVALCRNAKTPIPDSTRLISFLRDRDLNNLSKSKGVPSALVAQAKKLLMNRRSGQKKE